MATYSDAEALVRRLEPIINRAIAHNPIIRAAMKVREAIVWEAPDMEKRTVAVKFLPDLFNKDVSPSIFPYSPTLLATDLEKGKTVFVFYYQSLSNGVVMQNATWTAGGTGSSEGGVDSVNGMTGDVVLTASSLGIAEWALAPTKPTYSWTEITDKPSWIGSSKPTYSWTEITNKPTNFVTTDTAQTITGAKTLQDGVRLEGQGTASPELVFSRTSGGKYASFDGLSFKKWNSETQLYNEVKLPTLGGTLARTEDIPSSLKNPNALTITANGKTVTYDGSSAQSIDIPSSSGGSGSGTAISVEHGTAEVTEGDVFTIPTPEKINQTYLFLFNVTVYPAGSVTYGRIELEVTTGNRIAISPEYFDSIFHQYTMVANFTLEMVKSGLSTVNFFFNGEQITSTSAVDKQIECSFVEDYSSTENLISYTLLKIG